MRNDPRTLDGTRNVLVVENSRKLAVTGPTEANTQVCCLRTNSFGYYEPCLAFIVALNPSGRFTVDLWQDRSERVTVSAKAILWNTAA